MRASGLPTYPAESRPTDSESPMWATEVHEVWGVDPTFAGAGSDIVVPASRGRAVVVGPAGRAGSVVRGREVVRVVVGVGDFGDAALVARVVAGAGAAVVGAVAAACVVLGTRRSVGAGAAAAPLVTTAAATTVRTAASPARVRAVARRAMARRVPTASRRFRSDVTSGRSGRMAMMSSTSVDDHVLTAFNTATASTNKIHDDDVAREYGFRGGLVPGVDVYAYLTHLPVREWGRAWLEDG